MRTSQSVIVARRPTAINKQTECWNPSNVYFYDCNTIFTITTTPNNLLLILLRYSLASWFYIFMFNCCIACVSCSVYLCLSSILTNHDILVVICRGIRGLSRSHDYVNRPCFTQGTCDISSTAYCMLYSAFLQESDPKNNLQSPSWFQCHHEQISAFSHPDAASNFS